MYKMRYIGDVHGKFGPYKKIIENVKESIQVGDMGVGFKHSHRSGEIKDSPNPPYDAMTKEGVNHRFIRGNHDNLEVCAQHSQYILDCTVKDDTMFIGGAYSIDKEWRTEGYDWWADEELSYDQLNCAIDLYEKTKPRVMITHECPESISAALFPRRLNIGSSTRNAFDQMFALHKPELWIFGHWHMSRDEMIDGCRFICLAELEYKDI